MAAAPWDAGGRVASAQAGTVRLGAQGLAHGCSELASLVADAEREPISPVQAAPGSSRVLRVEVNGLLHDWFDVDEMGDFVRSSAFAGTLRENVSRYFGVPLEKQAIYDEDGLLTTNADFSRALQRVSPKLYVYDVTQMGPDLRDRTVEELEAIDAEVEQSWRHFGAQNPRRSQLSTSMSGGPTILAEKSLDASAWAEKASTAAFLDPGCAEGDRGGTSGSGWQPSGEQAPPPLPGAPPLAAVAAAQTPLPAAQRRCGAVVSVAGAAAAPAQGRQQRGRGTADFGNGSPAAEYLGEASPVPTTEEPQAFSLCAPSSNSVPALAATAATAPAGAHAVIQMPPAPLVGSATPAAPAPVGALAAAALAEPLSATLRGGVRVLSAVQPGQGRSAYLLDTSGPDVTNAALLNSSGSSRTLPGDASPLLVSARPVPAQQAGTVQVTPRYVVPQAGTISNANGGGGLRASSQLAPEPQRLDFGAYGEPAPLPLSGMVVAQPVVAQQRQSRPSSIPASVAATRAPSRERVGSVVQAAPSVQLLARAASQQRRTIDSGARSPRAATPPRAVTPVAVTPRAAASARRRSTTPVPVTVSPVWGARTVQAQPLVQQPYPMAHWPGVATTPPRSITPRRSVTPSRREVAVPGVASLSLGGHSPMSMAPAVRSVTPGRMAAAPHHGAWLQPAAQAATNASMSLCEWSSVLQR